MWWRTDVRVDAAGGNIHSWDDLVEMAANVAATMRRADLDGGDAHEVERAEILARLARVDADLRHIVPPGPSPLQCQECRHVVTRPADLRAGLCKTCHARLSKRRERARRAAKTAASA